MNIFEQASRQCLRFNSIRGAIMVEHLWQAPLQSKDGFDLDTIAKGIAKEIKEADEGSFVNTTTSPAKAENELRLEIVKFVIADKIAEQKAREQAVQIAARKKKLKDALAQKQDAALMDMTPEQIAAEIEALGS